MTFDELLADKGICVCAGSGGVGKTTTAAAIALGMAARGRKVAVLTIDPARRLADALGLDEIGGDARQVDPERLDAAGVEIPGELWAMTLDPKRTFDDVVHRHAPDDQTRDAVLGNRIYRELSSAVAGSQEYMAMEKLHQLHDEGRYDLLVLDTPPSRSALDFIDAPQRLSRFIDSKALALFAVPGRGALRFIGRGTGVVFSLMRRATGIDLLQDLSEFFTSFATMTGGFRERAESVDAMLRDSRTAFVLVTSPRSDAIDEAVFFHDRLTEAGLPFAGAIVNRVTPEQPEPPTDLGDRLAAALGEQRLAQRVEANFADMRRLAQRDAREVGRLAERLGSGPLITIPELDEEVHDLGGLGHIGAHLF